MKQTNQQKWDTAQLVLNEKKSRFVYETFKGSVMPTVVYEASVKGIEDIEITKFSVWSDKEPHCFKSPKNGDIIALWAFIEGFENAEKRIGLCYMRKYDTYSTSGAFKLSEIGQDRLSFNRDDLIPLQKELNEKYAPKEGYSPCAYCRKQVPTATLIEKKIFGRGRKQVWNSWKNKYESKACVTELYLKFCSPQCAANEQMAREG